MIRPRMPQKIAKACQPIAMPKTRAGLVVLHSDRVAKRGLITGLDLSGSPEPRVLKGIATLSCLGLLSAIANHHVHGFYVH